MGSYFSSNSQPEDESSTSVLRFPPGHHHLTPNDVFAVRHCLLHFLPLEVVAMILDAASYWPRITESRHTVCMINSHGRVNNAESDWCYLVTPPIPQRELQEGEDTEIKTKVKKVYFCFSALDGGLVGNYRVLCDRHFRPSTWFEAAILRPSTGGLLPEWLQPVQHHPVDIHSDRVSVNADLHDFGVKSPVDGKRRWFIRRNTGLSSGLEEHGVTWMEEIIGGDDICIGRGAGFVHLLQAGDRIAVMARAQYPNWIEVHRVTVEISYSA